MEEQEANRVDPATGFPRTHEPFTPMNNESPRTEELRLLAGEVMSTKNMRLRTNLPTRLLGPMMRLDIFDGHFDSPMARTITATIDERFVGHKGWGMGNLIKALQALRPTGTHGLEAMYGEESGVKGRINRITGRR